MMESALASDFDTFSDQLAWRSVLRISGTRSVLVRAVNGPKGTTQCERWTLKFRQRRLLAGDVDASKCYEEGVRF